MVWYFFLTEKSRKHQKPVSKLSYQYCLSPLTLFVTFGQCLHTHRKKINDPPEFIVLQTQLAFTIGSRNKQAILDSYQSEIFCYTMNPLMIKPREYKLSWPSLYGQDYWILASFFSTFLWTKTSSRSIKTQKKKGTRLISSHFDLTLGQ